MPFLAAVEVDQRQSFIHQADTLQEVVGASKLISRTVHQARRVAAAHEGVELVWPVSGVLRLLGPNPDQLANCASELRGLIEKDGLTATVSLIRRTGDYDEDLLTLERRIRKWKDAATTAVALPTLPYFVPCGIQPQLYAQHWVENGLNGRRELLSWQSKLRRSLRKNREPEFYWGLRFGDREIPEDFDDLVASDSDSYLALVKADVDGLGRLLAGLKFEALKEPLGLSAEEAGKEFTERLHQILLSSVQDAFNALESGSLNDHYPFRPLVVAGDDLLILSQRHLALELAAKIGHNYAIRAAGDEILQAAFAVSNPKTSEQLTLSCGVLFCKKGFPFDAAVDMAEELVRSAKDHRKGVGDGDACIDFHWLASGGREEIEESRRAGERYCFDGREYALYSRPWSLSMVEAYVEAAHGLAGFPRRKLNQLETITRLGGDLGELAYQQWWLGLAKEDRTCFRKALQGIQSRPGEEGEGQPFRPPPLWVGEASRQHTALLEMELLLQILKGRR